MGTRARPSGVVLSSADASIVKGMLIRGDRQHDVAAWFGVNGGRVGEIASGSRFRNVEAAPSSSLPPPGPYPSVREATIVIQALAEAKEALNRAERFVMKRADASPPSSQ